ncbi:hypothetical protein ONZ45_g18401 [Pleurotus djamor]|nr:hypothetical protein ONZ45_g18401 [Pleurotus djamor]
MSSAAEDFARLDTEQARKRIAHIARAFRRAVEQEIGRGWLANRIVDVREIVQTLRARDDHVQLQGGELGLLNAMVQSYCFGTSANFDDRVNDTIDLVRKFAPPDSDAYPLPRAPPPPGILRPDHAVTKSASGASGSSLEYAPLPIKVGPPRKRPAFEMGRPSQSGGQGQHHDVAAHQGKAHANADLNGPIQTTTPQRPLNTGSLKSQHAAPLIKVGPPRKVTTAQRAPNTLPQSSQPQQTSHPNPPPLASPSDSTFSESSSNRQPPVGKRDAKQTSHTNPPPLASPSDSTCSESSFHRRSRIGKRDADDEDYIADLHSAIDESSTLRRSGRKPAPARRLSPDKRASTSAPHSDRDEEMDSTDMPPKKKTKRPDKRSTAPPRDKEAWSSR